MNENNTLDGVDAGMTSGSTSVDRYFLSVNGVVSGPYTQSRLSTQRPQPPAHIWQVGQQEWADWSPPVPATLDDNRPPPTSVGRRSGQDNSTDGGNTAGQIVALPIKVIQRKRDLDNARRALDEVHRDLGAAAIDQEIALTKDASRHAAASCRKLMSDLAEVDAAVSREQRVSDRAAPSSADAKRSAAAIKNLHQKRATLVDRLRAVHLAFGGVIQDEPAVKEKLPELADRSLRAGQRVDAAAKSHDETAAESVRLRRRLADATGAFGKSAAAAISAAFAVGASLLIKYYVLTSKHESPPPPQDDSPAAMNARRDAAAAAARPVQPAAATPPRGPTLQEFVKQAAKAGLSRSQLALASVYVETTWKAFPGTTGGCTGSAVAAKLMPDGVLKLVTNKHVLDLEQLVKAKTDKGLWIGEYQIRVQFPSGRVCTVWKVRPEQTNVDLAVLHVDARTLKEGVDYVIAPTLPEGVQMQPGDDVVAIGNPNVSGEPLMNTQTFGHVSALRDAAIDGVTTNYIQTDAAINHGNSGGPLLLKQDERYFWIGVNTLGLGRDQGFQGLNMAIDARQALTVQYTGECEVTPAGMAGLLTDFYHFPASTYTP